ncbi:MAG: gamma-glutamyl-gamma-aminobutyrate hydrolase family protein, partial [Deltaproteobacteria bacterium]|nr:gamma-glutamyl-gamma-aminobutyrate hydrolase family protein [Deltaproteobacteria bacterium]
LADRGTKVVVVPATSTYDEVMAYQPDGVFLSNGPGDPAEATYAIATVKQLLGKKPLFGVCMGHQILGLALGGKTFKMKFGHRGVNQPVLNVQAKNVEISSHNHGFAVDPDSLPSGVTVSHRNLNDGTCEGLECTARNAFSVQYHPESAPGPHDSSYLFDQFVSRL